MEKYTEFHGLEGIVWESFGKLYGEDSSYLTEEAEEFDELDSIADSIPLPMCKESKRGANPVLHMLVMNRAAEIRHLHHGW